MIFGKNKQKYSVTNEVAEILENNFEILDFLLLQGEHVLFAHAQYQYRLFSLQIIYRCTNWHAVWLEKLSFNWRSYDAEQLPVKLREKLIRKIRERARKTLLGEEKWWF